MIKLERHQSSFWVLVAVSLLIGWRPLFHTCALSWRNDEYTQILLILPISATLLILERRSVRILSAWSLRAGPVLLMASIAIATLTWSLSNALSSDVRVALQMCALVLSWIAGFVLCFGARAARALMFPLLLLFGLVPPPDFILNYIITLLQEGSAWSAHALFAAFGVPVVQSGVFLRIPNLTIQIAQECSSIRSSSMLFVTAIVLGHVLLRTPGRKMLVIFLAIPLSVAKNGLRIFTIAMLGTRVDPAYLSGRLHRQGGILFFLIALTAIFGVIYLCQRSENWHEDRDSKVSGVGITAG